METLITIETVPIEIKFVEKEPLRLSSTQLAQASVIQTDDTQSVKPKPIRIDLQDTYEPSSNYNWNHSTYTATAKVEDDGNLKLNIQMEDGEARAIRFKQSVRSIDNMSGMIPDTGNTNDDEIAGMEISFNMGRLPSGMPAVNNLDTEFYPPDLEIEVTQQPKVIIKYVGGPIYVPRSADPDYKPIIGFEPATTIFEGSALDQKV
ncbi:MAG TPA: hypothetical protein DCY58_11520 [Acetobacterium sp.]|nr:hypothetical protein [Acetobacterium sp.]